MAGKEVPMEIMQHDQALLIVVDIQERLAPKIHGVDALRQRNRTLIGAAAKMAVPVVFTEQYPDGLGHTEVELIDLADQPTVFEKIHFSAAAEPGFLELIAGFGRKDMLVTGTEAHVCVLQTILGLINAGYRVRLVADATGSRREEDRALAIGRARDAGVGIVTTEMVLFEWLNRAGTQQFRQLLPEIKALADCR